jgi:GNAT superfamily N-acetyltransferase
MRIDSITSDDQAWVQATLDERWNGHWIVTRGRVHDAAQLPGFIARTDNSLQLRNGTIIPTGTAVGLITYVIEQKACEIVTLDSLYEGVSIGSGLVMAVRQAAEAAGCWRVWLITTNDNTHAMRFYQRRGFAMAALYPGAIEESRKMKPTIPMHGLDGISIRDEVEFELLLK